jgi:hypothetical protein
MSGVLEVSKEDILVEFSCDGKCDDKLENLQTRQFTTFYHARESSESISFVGFFMDLSRAVAEEAEEHRFIRFKFLLD